MCVQAQSCSMFLAVCMCMCVVAGVGGSRQRECDLLPGTQSSDTAPSLARHAASPPSLPFHLPFSFPSDFRLHLSLHIYSPLLPPASPPPLFAPSLHLRRPTQTSMNNSDRVALQVFPLSAPAASSPHPPIFCKTQMNFPKISTMLFFSLSLVDLGRVMNN